MISEPKIEHRDLQPYVAIRTQDLNLPVVIPQLMDEVFGWLQKQGIKDHDAPFVRYLVVDMPRHLDMEIGVALKTPVKGEGHIQAGTFPAGQYAVMLHTGAYDGLMPATAALLEWAEKNGVQWKSSGNEWESRIEFYLTDPQEEPNPEKWETELAFLTVG